MFTTAATSGKYTTTSSFKTMASLDGTADKPVPSVEIANGLIKVYDNAGNVRQQLEGGTTLGLLTLRDSYLDVLRADGVRFAWAVGLSGETGRRTLCTANGRIYFSDGTGDPVQQSSSPYLDYGGEANRLLIARGGLGTAASPAYIRPPKVTAAGPPSAITTGIGTTFSTVYSMSLATAHTSDIVVRGFLRPRLSLGAYRNQAIQYRVTMDGSALASVNAPVNPGTNLDQPTLPIYFPFSGIAAGTHTIALQVRAVNTGDTIDFPAANVCLMDAEARLS